VNSQVPRVYGNKADQEAVRCDVPHVQKHVLAATHRHHRAPGGFAFPA
jgi:hypothetical protein